MTKRHAYLLIAVTAAPTLPAFAAQECPVNPAVKLLAQDRAASELLDLRAILSRHVPACFPLEDNALINPERVGQRGQSALKFDCFS